MTTATAETDIRLETERLVLRRFRPSDAPAVRRLCDNWAIASMTSRLPHPYPLDGAVQWIGGQDADFHRERPFAVTLDGELIGSVGLVGEAESFELGYWIGEPWWGRGFATEAARAMCSFAFERLDAEQVTAGHFVINDASGRVLAKCGFRYTGQDKEYSLARDAEVDCKRMVLSREDWQAASAGSAA